MIPFHPSPARRRLVAWLGCGALLWLAGNAQGIEQVSLQLKWWHQFQFAGYYAAQARGFYQSEGLEVQIVEGGPARAPLAAVVSGATQYGVSDSDVVLARMKGQPVVACAAIFQHSPYVILSRRDRKIRSPADLIGARVMLSDDQGAAQLQAMLRREGIKPGQVQIERHSWDLADLAAGRVDAVSAYAMVEPEQLRALGVEPATLRALDYGVDFYGDTLFTHEAELRAYPERVAAFVRASLRGWTYALEHPEEITDLILKMDGVTARGATREEMLRQAEGMREYILPNVVEIGHMNEGRWRHIARTFAEQGMAPVNFPLEGFLYDPNPPPDPALRRKLLALGLGGLAVAGLALLWTIQMRREVRKRTAELQTALSEAGRFRAALDEVPSYIYMKDTASRYFYANRPTLKLFGCSAEELAGSEDARFFPPDTVKQLRELDLRVLAGGQTNEEVDVVGPTGERRIYWEVKSPIFEESGNRNIWGVLGISTDITERKRMEEALRASEGRYRALFEHAPDGIVIADPESTYIDANASICRMLGYTREELIGKSAADILVPTEIPQVQSALRAIRAELPYHREWKFRRKDGSTFGAEVIATLLPDGNLLGMIRDITERRRTEERFRRLVESNAQGVMFFKTSGEITGANDAFLNLVGYSREDLEAGRMNWMAMTPPEHTELCRRAMEEIAAKGFFAPYEKEYFRKDGSRVPLLLGAASFEDSPEEGVAFAVDLTERNKLEQQYFRAQRMESIGTLAGGIAHDLNNVLSPIMMSLDLLKMKFTDAESQELLTIISTSAARGSDMVRQVLSFARGVEGQRIEVPVGRLIQEIEKITNETFLKHIRVRTDLPPDLWTVSGDPTQIHQVLLNFCVNARDAMPTAGTLTLSARNVMLDEQYATSNPEAKPGPYVVITIEDNGIGMTPEVLEKIFDPFFTTKEVGKGTGLGLSTSLAIVKSHAGFIQAASEVGVGTKFEIYLPAQTEASAASLAIPEAEMPRGHGEWILVVDDELAVRLITQQTLEAFGYHVILAAGGAEAVNLFARQSTKIAAVLADMMMPGIDGPATIQILRKMNPTLPVIAASGLTTNEHIARAVSIGVKHFLPKPFTAETLLKTLRKVLSGG